MDKRKSDLNGGPLWLSSLLLPSYKKEEAGKFCLGVCELFYQFFCFQKSYIAIATVRICPELRAWLKIVWLFFMHDLVLQHWFSLNNSKAICLGHLGWIGFAWQGFGSREATEVVSLSICWKLPLHPIKQFQPPPRWTCHWLRLNPSVMIIVILGEGELRRREPMLEQICCQDLWAHGTDPQWRIL